MQKQSLWINLESVYTSIHVDIISLLTESEVKSKIKSVRSQYTRERQKAKKRKSGQGTDELYVSKWIHYERLKFLDEYVIPKSST